ncbi:hypothetical protein GCM10010400_63070 [Streptomyces aculeolatus]
MWAADTHLTTRSGVWLPLRAESVLPRRAIGQDTGQDAGRDTGGALRGIRSLRERTDGDTGGERVTNWTTPLRGHRPTRSGRRAADSHQASALHPVDGSRK